MSEDVRNESSGTIGGHSVQAGQIHGGVHFHHDGDSERTPVVPRQLPTASRHFTNRAVEQDALTTPLNGSATEDRVLVSTVDGTAGREQTERTTRSDQRRASAKSRAMTPRSRHVSALPARNPPNGRGRRSTAHHRGPSSPAHKRHRW